MAATSDSLIEIGSEAEAALFGAMLREIWAVVGGGPEALRRVAATEAGSLPSVFAVSDLAAASIAAAGLAISELAAASGGRPSQRRRRSPARFVLVWPVLAAGGMGPAAALGPDRRRLRNVRRVDTPAHQCAASPRRGFGGAWRRGRQGERRARRRGVERRRARRGGRRQGRLRGAHAFDRGMGPPSARRGGRRPNR